MPTTMTVSPAMTWVRSEIGSISFSVYLGGPEGSQFKKRLNPRSR